MLCGYAGRLGTPVFVHEFPLVKVWAGREHDNDMGRKMRRILLIGF